MIPLQFLRSLTDRIRRKGLFDPLGAAWNIGGGLLDFHLNPLALKTSKLPPPNWPQIRTEMVRAGLEVAPYWINKGGSAGHGPGSAILHSVHDICRAQLPVDSAKRPITSLLE